jgi:hypothetical protein
MVVTRQPRLNAALRKPSETMGDTHKAESSG